MNALDKNITIKATELFSKYGIRGITMDEISREVGISKKTLYNYIIDKEDLIKISCDNELNRISGVMQEAYDKREDSLQKHISVITKIAEILQSRSIVAEHDLRKYYPEIAEWVREEFNKIICSYLSKSIIAGIRDGFFRTDIDADFIAKHELIQLEQHISVEKHISAKDLKQLLSFNLRGIISELGMEELNNKQEKTKI